MDVIYIDGDLLAAFQLQDASPRSFKSGLCGMKSLKPIPLLLCVKCVAAYHWPLSLVSSAPIPSDVGNQPTLSRDEEAHRL